MLRNFVKRKRSLGYLKSSSVERGFRRRPPSPHRVCAREKEGESALAPLKITVFSPNKGFNGPNKVASHLADMI